MNHGANRQRQREGFTLIELVLAMGFISVLLLAIALTIIQIGQIYNRGMTLKAVNQTARVLTDDLKRSLTASEGFNVDTNFEASGTAGARLCLGTYSYIWNFGKAIQNNDAALAKYEDSALKDPVRMVKVPDPAGLYCERSADTGDLKQKNIRQVDTDNKSAIEMLNSGDRNLTLHQFSLTAANNTYDSTTGQHLYTVSFTIGTGDAKALTPDQTSCLPPGDPNADFAYCTVQQFKLVIRAGNRVN